MRIDKTNIGLCILGLILLALLCVGPTALYMCYSSAEKVVQNIPELGARVPLSGIKIKQLLYVDREVREQWAWGSGLVALGEDGIVYRIVEALDPTNENRIIVSWTRAW